MADLSVDTLLRVRSKRRVLLISRGLLGRSRRHYCHERWATCICVAARSTWDERVQRVECSEFLLKWKYALVPAWYDKASAGFTEDNVHVTNIGSVTTNVSGQPFARGVMNILLGLRGVVLNPGITVPGTIRQIAEHRAITGTPNLMEGLIC